MLQPRKMRTEARTKHIPHCSICGEPERAWNPRTRKSEVRQFSTDVKEILCSTCLQRNLHRNSEQE
jgi:ribosomal protein L34E